MFQGSFQSLETAQGFHIHVTSTGPGRIDWSDGSYTFIDSVDHSSGHDVGQGTSVFAETHTDGADFYSAAGVFEFRRTFHEVEHFTASNGVVPGRPEQGPLPLLRRLLTRTRCD